MKINWKVRFKNKIWVIGFIAQIFLLTELLLIGTHAAAKLKTSSFIESLARSHVNGIANCFNLPNKSTAVYHTVKSGDTVYSLSQAYGSTAQQIKDWNGLDANYTIYIGQVLRVK
ncbi:LysM domain-containing protein [Psychrobacillus sp. OK032]|uniref:LysM peptidoglycan-binding domain-containing protein n=1 Tax=Psychrobacillus sp. OK032 TaxID=1884358 RepID=UPI0008B0068E|nr:LysM domain-containing protein [Psychrobacillus sp. OK032]SES23165.1 N-acetylmuramoyl-L-alanine amidase [Psychrobacillus sp. OK032]